MWKSVAARNVRTFAGTRQIGPALVGSGRRGEGERIVQEHSIFGRRISSSSVEKILNLDPLSPKLSSFRRTKIVCTIGPASWERDGIKSLLKAGMNILRVNCSHGNHELYEKVITTAREVVREEDTRRHALLDDVNVSLGIALDTKGPEIRLGDFACKTPVHFPLGTEVRLHTNEKWREKMGQNDLFVDYIALAKTVSIGTNIFIDDGLQSLKVVGISTDDDGHDVVSCVSENTAYLSNRKGVNIPGAVLDLPSVSSKDIKDLEFAKAMKVDFIFASFVRKADHVREIRDITGPEIAIIAKIENSEGIRNIDEILTEADGVMVARGDLGIEIPQESVFLAQKLIVSKANLKGKPVICATQMLESMTRAPRPTRAECADTANAVLDGCDAVMLSGETANGVNPSLCVSTMSRICQTAEYSIDNRQTTETIRELGAFPESGKVLCESLVISAVIASAEERAKCIIILTDSGISARLASKYRPAATIVCVTSNQHAARKLQLYYGIRVHAVPKGMDMQESISSAMKRCFKWGLVEKGDRVVVVHSQGSSMKLAEVPAWIDRPYS